MFEGRVQMSLLFQVANVSEVLVVHVSVDSEKALQDGFGNGHEILRKRHTCRKNASRDSKMSDNGRYFPTLQQFCREVISLTKAQKGRVISCGYVEEGNIGGIFAISSP